jgi:cbb3-type cytochrome c oxidase subunit II
MNQLERFSAIFLVAGVLFFVVAFGVLGVWPAIMSTKIDKPVAAYPQEIPENFTQYYETYDDYKKALLHGRDLYIQEACWHCHSQYVRPVSKESTRYGLVSVPFEYENELHLPQLFGTRRVGPDLIRVAGKHSNDWHFAHLYDPRSVVPESVMPSFPWFFDETQDPPVPNEDGVALVAYLQSLGYWAKDVYRLEDRRYNPQFPPDPFATSERAME